MIRILQSKIFSAGLVLLIAWLSLSAYQIRLEKDETDTQVANVEAKIKILEQNNESIRQYLEYLKSPEFLARQARLKLNYKAADEQVAYVYRDEKEVEPHREEIQEPNILVKIKNWLYNLVR